MADKLGWILVHSSKIYDDDEEYETPQQQLKADYTPGMLWHWKRFRPLKKGGPYTLLFAWKGEIFGEAKVYVTHQTARIGRIRYNFAFELNDYIETKSVALADIKVHRYRDLVALTPQRLQTYRKLAARKRSR